MSNVTICSSCWIVMGSNEMALKWPWCGCVTGSNTTNDQTANCGLWKYQEEEPVRLPATEENWWNVLMDLNFILNRDYKDGRLEHTKPDQRVWSKTKHEVPWICAHKQGFASVEECRECAEKHVAHERTSTENWDVRLSLQSSTPSRCLFRKCSSWHLALSMRS